MLKDNSDTDITAEADFVIVGSGAAGATCARWLAAAGKSVIVIEEGAPAAPAGGDALEVMTTLFRDAGASATIGEMSYPCYRASV
jgi:choline dehydrogenase-like flavoprotein